MMERFINFINSHKTVRDILRGVSVWLMLTAIYIYLLYADLSTAPEFIYNQF